MVQVQRSPASQQTRQVGHLAQVHAHQGKIELPVLDQLARALLGIDGHRHIEAHSPQVIRDQVRRIFADAVAAFVIGDDRQRRLLYHHTHMLVQRAVASQVVPAQVVHQL